MLIRERVASTNMRLYCMDAPRWFAINKAPHNVAKFDALHDYLAMITRRRPSPGLCLDGSGVFPAPARYRGGAGDAADRLEGTRAVVV
jgi:hypothetical protein